MRCLFLNLGSHNGLLACSTEREVIALLPLHARMGDHELIALIEEILAHAEWSYPELNSIACVVGPGGFTSLRVAVAAANTLADQLGIPSAGIHLSDLYATRAPRSPLPASSFLWLHSTKKNELFVRGFGTLSTSFPDAHCLTLDALRERLALPFPTWIGELLPEHEAYIRAMGGQPAALRPVTEVLPAFLSVLTFERKLLLPWYGRGF